MMSEIIPVLPVMTEAERQEHTDASRDAARDAIRSAYFTGTPDLKESR